MYKTQYRWEKQSNQTESFKEFKQKNIMTATLIGLSSALLTILIVALFRRLDRNVFFGLILSGIGFLYVGYTWTSFIEFIMNILQAILFLLLAYFGIKKNSYFLIAGYILHGLWDLIYGHIGNSGLLPPDYDMFCMTYDFIIGFYLLMLKYQKSRNE